MSKNPNGPFYLTPGAIRIVGISGKARSGKDFLMEHVIAPLFDRPLPVSLADHFKVSCVAKGYQPRPRWAPFVPPFLAKRFLPKPVELDIRQMWELDKDVAHREALQLEGTEFGRNVYGEAIWLKHAEAWLYRYATKGIRDFYIADVRYPNEVAWVEALGGTVYRITGDRGGLTDGRGAHISETALDDYPFRRLVDNSKGREHLVTEELRAMIAEDYGLRRGENSERFLLAG